MKPSYLWLSLIIITVAAFFNSIQHPFVHDDIVFIAQNPQIHRLDNIADIFFPLPSVHPTGVNAYYRPVLEVVYRLEYALFGLNPYGFHLVNLCLHIANGLLLFGLLQRLGLAVSLAWLVSVFFLIHPVQTEAVACVAGISNLLMAFLILLAMHAYWRGWFIVSVLLLWVALLTKEQAVMFAVLVMFLDIYRQQNRGQRPILRWGILAGVTAASLVWRGVVTGTSLIRDILQSPGELILRIKAIAPVLLTDLRLIIWPNDLHYYRSHDILQPYLTSWFILAALGVILVLIYRRVEAMRGAIILGGGWFFITILPLLNIVPLINEYSLILTAEHFLYLPIVGVLIIIAAAIGQIENGGQRPIFQVMVIVLIALCLCITIRQNTQWRDEITLFKRTVQFEPNFARGHLLLAKAYYFSNRMDEAQAHFAHAFRIMTSYAKKVRDPQAKGFYLGFMKGILFDWAHTFEAKGQWQAALDKYDQAIAIDGQDPILRQNALFCRQQLQRLP